MPPSPSPPATPPEPPPPSATVHSPSTSPAPEQHSVLGLLAARVVAAAGAAFGPEAAAGLPGDPVLPTRDPRHGDYQSPVAMGLARTLRRPPLELATELAAALDVADVCHEPEVAPPGFVNLRLRPEWLAGRLVAGLGDERLGIPPVEPAQTVIIDYSAPNVAKEMHVGHLRSTIIGDCLANVFEFLGHRVEGVNHVGDFGTQFGMLVTHLEETQPDALEAGEADIADLEAFYKEANTRFQHDPDFAERARARVVDLQAGEPRARAAWRSLLATSRKVNQQVYDLLGVTRLVERGESFYEPMLPEVVAELRAKGLAVEDQGATVVFVPGFTNKQGDPLPLIVQKRDGGYNYATTDLAALRYRVAEQGADRILYVVGADQAQHLEMVFAVARMAGWVPDHVRTEHVPFGQVQGEGGKKLRTRSGDTVHLADLLTEAVDRARAFVLERAAERGEDPPADLDRVAHVIGIGAVKYADLAQNRQSNYVFSYDRMLSLKGNTAPYLQYAYARMRSILREAGWADGPPAGVEVRLEDEAEVELARQVVQLADVLDRVVADDAPNHLCAHLYELSQAYNQFYERCPVLRSEEPTRTSRLALCEATSATLRLGLGLLGIAVLERI